MKKVVSPCEMQQSAFLTQMKKERCQEMRICQTLDRTLCTYTKGHFMIYHWLQNSFWIALYVCTEGILVCLFVLCRRGRHDAQMFSTLMIQKRKNVNIFFQNPNRDPQMSEIYYNMILHSQCVCILFLKNKKSVCVLSIVTVEVTSYIYFLLLVRMRRYTHTQ